MPTREVILASRIGLHGRPAALLVRTAAAQPVPIRISRPGAAPVDATSILAVLSLGARHGDPLTLEATGDGADTALDAIADLLAQDLDAEPAET
jgi:phosphocarrier protein HPr